MTTTQTEQEDNFRLRKAKEFLDYSKALENEARKSLALAIEQSNRAKEKYEGLFAECELRAVSARKNGLIDTTKNY